MVKNLILTTLLFTSFQIKAQVNEKVIFQNDGFYAVANFTDPDTANWRDGYILEIVEPRWYE